MHKNKKRSGIPVFVSLAMTVSLVMSSPGGTAAEAEPATNAKTAAGGEYINYLAEIVESDDIEMNELQYKTLASFRKIDDYPLYVMEYGADYHFAHLLKTGLRQFSYPPPDRENSTGQEACSSIAALNPQGHAIFGHNIDWNKLSLLLLFTSPPGGYASVSVVWLDQLGYSEESFPPLSYDNCIGLLDAPFWPHDGMNECGVAIGEMTSSGQHFRHPRKITLNGLHVIRLVLDYAKNVDEAIALLQKYNNSSSGEVHYLVADASGKSAVIEYYRGRLRFTLNPEPWQVATNFTIKNLPPQRILHLCHRYETAYTALKKAGGKISRETALNILKDISLYSTQWSVVYDMTSGDIQAAAGQKYNQIKEFKLKMKTGKQGDIANSPPKVEREKNTDPKPGDGQWIKRYPNGSRLCQYQFKNGKRNGKNIWWYEKGNKKIEREYKDGKLSGQWIEWDEYGRKIGQGSFKNGNGIFKYLYANGNTRAKKEYADGKLKLYRWYYEQGHKRGEGKYIEPIGEWLFAH
jgi:antitoxin component YwqK of YwqJK toxin-antitoxin module